MLRRSMALFTLSTKFLTYGLLSPMDNLNSLLLESLQLLLIGMGTVFVILVMLIFLITFVSRMLREEAIEEPHYASSASSTAVAQKKTDNNQLIAVISMAVSAYKKRHSSH